MLMNYYEAKVFKKGGWVMFVSGGKVSGISFFVYMYTVSMIIF